MSEKIIGGSEGHGSHGKLYKYLAIGIGVFVILFSIVVFLVYIILQPSKPSFILQDVTVYKFNVSTTPPYTLSINMQVTLTSINPNSHIGIDYQPGLDLYATYRGQQVTLASLMPQTYQGHKEIVVWSPFLNGASVPISPFLGQVLGQDLNVGAVLMNIKLDGKVKWKVGSWISGNYHLNVHCPANIMFGDMIIHGGIAVAPGVIKGQPVDHCSVETGL